MFTVNSLVPYSEDINGLKVITVSKLNLNYSSFFYFSPVAINLDQGGFKVYRLQRRRNHGER